MSDLSAAGRRLEEYVRFYLPQTPWGSNMTELCRQADINRNTLYGWFSGHRAPTSRALDRLAGALGRPVSDLWAAWEGRDLQPASLEAAVAELVKVQAETNEQITMLVTKLDALASYTLSSQVARAAEEVRRFALEAGGSDSPPRLGQAAGGTSAVRASAPTRRRGRRSGQSAEPPPGSA